MIAGVEITIAGEMIVIKGDRKVWTDHAEISDRVCLHRLGGEEVAAGVGIDVAARAAAEVAVHLVEDRVGHDRVEVDVAVEMIVIDRWRFLRGDLILR